MICTLRWTNSSGDSTLTWDPELEEAVNEAMQEARAKFDEKVRDQKWWAYSVDREDKSMTLTREFDPTAEEIVMHSQPVGG